MDSNYMNALLTSGFFCSTQWLRDLLLSMNFPNSHCLLGITGKHAGQQDPTSLGSTAFGKVKQVTAE